MTVGIRIKETMLISQKRRISSYFGAVLLMVTAASMAADPSHYRDRTNYMAPHAAGPISINGIADEEIWQHAQWQELKYRWLGPEYSAEDFQGHFKIVWTDTQVVILAEIVDDILIDTHRNPLTQYWDDDCLEIFLDEDFSGGDHQFNHNAFAYHMSLDNQAIDIGTDKLARNYSHHVTSHWTQHDDKLTWELAIDVYSDDYVDESGTNVPQTLTAGKIIGLMIAYCDNDGSELRENFIGSESVPEGPKDRGWIDAGLFGSLVLAE